MKNGQTIGTVRALYRYPVKSMAAETLSSVEVGWHGVAGDRRWAFLRPNSERSGFPWMTIREKADMWQYKPSFADAADVEGAMVTVTSPDERQYDVTDPDLAAELGDGVRVMKVYSGVFDTFPLSLLSLQSVDQLGRDIASTLTGLRFRPNILIDAVGGEPFPEEAWQGATLRIGGLRFRLDQRDARCMMVNIDPEQPATVNPDVLKTIVKTRGARFGMYGSTVEPGTVAVGDVVTLLET